MYFSGIHSIQLQPHAILNQLKSALFSESTSTAPTEHPDGACLLACVNGCCFILILLFKHVKSWYSMCFTTGTNFLFTHSYIFFHSFFFFFTLFSSIHKRKDSLYNMTRIRYNTTQGLVDISVFPAELYIFLLCSFSAAMCARLPYIGNVYFAVHLCKLQPII